MTDSPRVLETSWRELQNKTDGCTECSSNSIDEICCPRGDIKIYDPPPETSCLFVSWNPPNKTNKNFWNNDQDNLRRDLFDVLRNIGYNIQSLTDFVQKGFFLVHALKCGTNPPSLTDERNRPQSFTDRALALCVPVFLQNEILNHVKPKKICLLGTVPKLALGMISRDVHEWQASPSEGATKWIRLECGEVAVLYTCFLDYHWKAQVTEHLRTFVTHGVREHGLVIEAALCLGRVYEGSDIADLRHVRLIVEQQLTPSYSATKPSSDDLEALLALAIATAILQSERGVHKYTQRTFQATFARAFAKAGLGDDPRKWIDLYNPKTAEILELSRIIGSRSREDMAFTLLNWGTH